MLNKRHAGRFSVLTPLSVSIFSKMKKMSSDWKTSPQYKAFFYSTEESKLMTSALVELEYLRIGHGKITRLF